MSGIKARFIEPFWHLASSLFVREQRLLLRIQRQGLSCSLAQFRSNFALLLEDVEVLDDTEVLLGLCADLLATKTRISIELESIPEVMRLLTELPCSWHDLDKVELPCHPKAQIRDVRK
ncbi:hypothetical protein ACLOJK_024714 [Asimina triloba]